MGNGKSIDRPPRKGKQINKQQEEDLHDVLYALVDFDKGCVSLGTV